MSISDQYAGTEDARVHTAREILDESVDLADHTAAVYRVGQLEVAVDMLRRYAE